MSFSRIFEVKFGSLHIPGLTYRVLALMLVLSGAFLTAFRDRIGKYMMAFTALLMVSSVFSVWRGGSVQMLMNDWFLALVMFAATASLISDFPQFMQAARTMAFGTLVLTLIALKMGSMEATGRLTLPQGRFANPNELAQALLFSMPFWWAMYSLTRSLAMKLFAVGTLVLMLYVMSKTGSRGALIATTVILTIMFFRASVTGKVKVLSGAVVLFAIAILIVPARLRDRYLTLFSPDNTTANDAGFVDSAALSADSRRQLLIESLILTARHPLLGVGPDQFQVAENDMARAEGRPKGAWLGTHNTFTQVSSECGIPAFICFASMVILSFRYSYSLYQKTKKRPEWKEIHMYAMALNYSLIVFMVTGMFIHVAYTMFLPLFSGLAVSLRRTSAQVMGEEPTPHAVIAWPATGRPRQPRAARVPAVRPLFRHEQQHIG